MVVVQSVSRVQTLLPPYGLEHARLPCPSLSPGVCSNSLSEWRHLTILSSVTPFSSCLQSLGHQGLFQWVGSSHQTAKVLDLLLKQQSFQWIFRVDFLSDQLVWSCSLRDSQESSPAPLFKSISSLALSLLYGPALTSVHDYWKNYSFDYTDLCWQSDVSAF